jgi:hypothetical protein
VSGHTPWREHREARMREMTPEERTETRARRRKLLEDFQREVWLLNVEERFLNAMQAAAAGETTDWHVWPRTGEIAGIFP